MLVVDYMNWFKGNKELKIYYIFIKLERSGEFDSIKCLWRCKAREIFIYIDGWFIFLGNSLVVLFSKVEDMYSLWFNDFIFRLYRRDVFVCL